MHDWRAEIRARLSSARLHPQDEAEMVEEMGQHLEEQFAELAPKIGATAAREQLLAPLHDRGFGDAATRRRRRARPTGAHTWSSTSLWRDVRYACRSLLRSPGTMVAGTLALALGIGLTAVMYSIIYGLLIKGLPFREPERIATIKLVAPAGPSDFDAPMPFADFAHFRSHQRSFGALGAYTVGTATVTGGDRPERVSGGRVTAGVFDVVGVRPLLGRTFAASDNEPAAPPTAILSYALWRDRYGGDSSMIGSTIRANGRPYTVVGIMPQGFEFPREAKLWLSLQVAAASLRPGEGPGVMIVGRLRPGVTYESVNAEFAGLSQRLVSERPPGAAELRPIVQPFIRAMVPSRVYSMLYAMLGAVMLVLLVACANVANLLLDRTVGRMREIGIRTALGASRLAVVRQSLIESSILAGLAAVLGTALTHVGIAAFNRAMVGTEPLPFWADIRLHPPVLLFVLGMAVLATLVSGLLPALQSARLDVSAILKDESHAASALRAGRMSRAIVAAEIALSSALLLAAGFLTKSIVNLRTVEPGFVSRGVYTARLSASSADTAQQRRFFEVVEQQLAARPGVAGAYLGDGLPGGRWSGDKVQVEGRVYAREQDPGTTRRLAVSPGFFRTFGAPVLRGRGITAHDRAGSPPVAVVSESFVRRHLQGADPLGRRIRLGGADGWGEWMTIVGVVPSLYAASAQDPWPADVLTAFWQERRWPSASVAVRGAADVASVASIRQVVAALDPEVPVYDPASMDDVLARSMWPFTVFGTMFVIFGVTSLILAAIGLYAVMAFSASRRIREMGIRMAIGASAGDVVRLVMRQGARQVLLGIAVGFALGGALVRLARAVLFEVQPSDPAVFVLVAGVLGVAAFVACLIPAIRATRVDPVIALRAE
jgi:predicted permease